jgi:hypothetical protein
MNSPKDLKEKKKAARRPDTTHVVERVFIYYLFLFLKKKKKKKEKEERKKKEKRKKRRKRRKNESECPEGFLFVEGKKIAWWTIFLVNEREGFFGGGLVNKTKRKRKEKEKEEKKKKE